MDNQLFLKELLPVLNKHLETSETWGFISAINSVLDKKDMPFYLRLSANGLVTVDKDLPREVNAKNMLDKSRMNRAIRAVVRERKFQEATFGDSGKGWRPAEWLSFIRTYMIEADAVLTEASDSEQARLSQMNVMRKICALALAAMEDQGIVHRSPLDLHPVLGDKMCPELSPEKPSCIICGSTKGDPHFDSCRYAGGWL